MSDKQLKELKNRILSLQDENQQLQRAKNDLDFERRRLRSLYELSTDQSISIEEQIIKSLKVGLEILNLDMGIVSQIHENTYIIMYFYAPHTELFKRQEFELGETYCNITLSANDVIAINNMGLSKYSGHPCYKAFNLESYIGVPVLVNGQRFGTLNFSSSKVKGTPFSDSDMDYVRLMGRWLSSVLEKEKSKKEIYLYKDHLEELVEQKTMQLLEAQKHEAIGTLAGGIAHDFNNILSGILGYSQLVEFNVNDPKTIKSHIQNVLKGVYRATELVKQILTLSRKSEYEKSPVKISLIVMEALKLIRSTIPATITIRENITSDAMVFADPTQIHQVIMNLCTNAYHSMRSTGGILTVVLKEIQISNQNKSDRLNEAPGKYLRLEVSDTGHGMEEAILGKIFDPYFTTKDKGEGTGLGLALVYGIIEDHEGYLEAESVVGKGSLFRISLPTTDKRKISENQKKDTKFSIKGTEKIMFVDDEGCISSSSSDFLENYGYTVSTFPNGEQAFNAFDKNPYRFDLIITDMTMPVMAGDELAKRLLAIRNDIPIILCTGYSNNLSEETALELGIKRYLQKPVSYEHLLIVIREVLDDKS